MGKLSAPSTITSQPAPMMRSAFSDVSRSSNCTTFDIGVQRLDRFRRRAHLRLTEPRGRVDDLSLQVRLVDDVRVDDAELADAGGGEVERRGRAEAPRADQEHPRFEQLELSFLADLGNQQVARVAAPLLRLEAVVDDDREAVSLPAREARLVRADVLVAELLQRLRGERRADAGGARQDDRRLVVSAQCARSSIRGGREGCGRRSGCAPRPTRSARGRR